MSHPILVDAIEENFVPLCIYNNTKGDSDEATLKKFSEPAWNYPVIHFCDSKAKSELRIAKDYSLKRIVDEAKKNLAKHKRPIPASLEILSTQLAPKKVETAIFGMT